MKLSDFPFSYSLIGALLMLITGKNISMENIFSASYAPLLLIMGLFSKTLAISDPLAVYSCSLHLEGH